MSRPTGESADRLSTAAALRILSRATLNQPLTVRARAALRLVVSPLASLPELVPLNSRICDIGCGTGAFLALLAGTRSPTALFGTELSAAAAAAATAAVARTDATVECRIFLTADPVSTGAIPGCDIVTMVDVLHHVPRGVQQDFIKRLADVMRPGARLLLKEIDGARKLGALANRAHDLVFSASVAHERPAAVLQRWLLEAGLEVEYRHEAFVLWYPHVTLVARKRS